MNYSIRLTGLLTVLAISVFGFLASGFKNGLNTGLYADSQGQNLFDPDPNHLWNRVYRQLFVRAGPGDREYGYDELDPPLWHETTYLLTDPSNQEAIALLDEFLSTHGEGLIADPLRRAMLQRDLWAIFDWSASRTDDYRVQRRALQARLAQVIQRLALTANEIAALPDNYGAALASNSLPAQYEPEQRADVGFLPQDLLSESASWICLGNIYGDLATPQHFHDFGGRSAFLVFLRLPGGRESTLEYLAKLAKGSTQFPAGTQVALVRQMMLVDTEGELRPTRLIESVQIRVYRGDPGTMATEAQHFFKFKLSQARLFSGDAGGLVAVLPGERDIAMLAVHGVDWELRDELQMCGACHGGRGIESVLSNRNASHGLGPARPMDQVRLSIYLKSQQFTWGLLQGLWQYEGATPGAHGE
jgi:hypothetical protein